MGVEFQSWLGCRRTPVLLKLTVRECLTKLLILLEFPLNRRFAKKGLKKAKIRATLNANASPVFPPKPKNQVKPNRLRSSLGMC